MKSDLSIFWQKELQGIRWMISNIKTSRLFSNPLWLEAMLSPEKSVHFPC
jgi:hypothetical protein